MAEETEDPARTFPPALFGGILAAGVIYLLVTGTASMIVPTADLGDSDGPLLEVVEQGPVGIRRSCSRGSPCSPWPTAR